MLLRHNNLIIKYLYTHWDICVELIPDIILLVNFVKERNTKIKKLSLVILLFPIF
jgi:hypothetical protein